MPSFAAFADYGEVNLCRICGAECGQGRYCERHAATLRLVGPQVQRVIARARRRRYWTQHRVDDLARGIASRAVARAVWEVRNA